MTAKDELMVRITTLVVILMGFAIAIRAADEANSQTPADQYKALLHQYEQVGGARDFAEKFIELAQHHSNDPVAVDALLWVVDNLRNRLETTRALELLAEHHLTSEKLADACPSIARTYSTAAEKLLRAALEDSPHEVVRAQACFYLARLLDQQDAVVKQLKTQPELAPRVLQYYGNDYGQHLASLRPGDLEKQRAQVYERMLKSFAEVTAQDSTMGKIAEQALFEIRHLSLGKPAPQIDGDDIHGQPFKLSDYQGKVVMLSFWGHW